ncbi:MAG: polysaccharide lyase family 8 super-sandwich domain-containing protein [Agriterribacter sp.]
MSRFHDSFIASTAVADLNTQVNNNLASQKSDGSWSDIDYQSHAQTIWPPSNHLSRLELYAKAFTNELSGYYGSADVLEKLKTGIEFWVNISPAPSSTNWWFGTIGVPKQVGNILIALRLSQADISSDLETKFIGWMTGGRPISEFVGEGGANLTDVAQHYIMRACLQNDGTLLSETVSTVADAIKIDASAGIQQDFSFKAHGPQLSTYAYGSEFVKGIGVIGTSVAGTAYAITAEKMAIFSNFIRKGFMKPVRGMFSDFNNFGRGISRNNAGRAPADLIETISKIDLPQYASEYANTIARMKGEQPPSYNVSPEHYHYWKTDYSLHIRPGYTFGLRSVSTRTVKSEQGNGESLKCNFLTDGVTYIGVTGDEYSKIFPIWDWNKIPGTTAPEITTFPDVPDWGVNYGKTSFVGGVSDGVYGASTFVLDDYKITAKKAWFFFDDEVVCLGSGINSTAAEAINTTVNQSFLTTEVIASTTNGTTATLSPQAQQAYTGNLKWVSQGNIGYFFPSGGNLTLSNQTQTGTWKSINSSQSDAQVSGNVFKLWINHGVKPVNSAYAYIVVPGLGTQEQMQAYDMSRIQILANTDNIQAIRHTALDRLQIVFYKAGEFTNGTTVVKVDQPCVLTLKNLQTNNVTVHVADPSQSQAQITVSLKTDLFTVTRTGTFALPQGDFAGSTVSGTINENSPPAPTYTEKSIDVLSDAFVKNGTGNTTKNYGNAGYLAVQNSVYASYLKFDVSQIRPAQVYSAKLVLNPLDDSNGDQWPLYLVDDNNWQEVTTENSDGITWSNAPAAGKLISTYTGGSKGTPVEIDITSALKNLVSGQQYISFKLMSTAGTGNYSGFSSRQSSTASNRPKIVYTSVDPVLTIEGTLTAFPGTVVGSTSAEQSYKVSGQSLSENITVTAPAGFQISLSSGTEFTSMLTIPQINGTVLPTTIYVRLAPDQATGSMNGLNITHVTSDLARNMAVSGKSLAMEPTQKGTATEQAITETSATIQVSDGTGNRRIVVARQGSAPGFVPTDGMSVSGVNADFAQAADQGDGSRIVYDGDGQNITATGLNGPIRYYFAVYEYNVGTNDSYNYLSDPATLTVTTSIPASGMTYQTALDDAWVGDGDRANTNYGSEAVLKAGNDQASGVYQAYFRFDLSSMPADMKKAELMLYVKQSPTSGAGWEFFSVDNSGNWTEQGITWSNKPAAIKKIGAAPFQEGGTILRLDITEVLKQRLGTGSKRISAADDFTILAVAPDANGVSEFASKEDATAANRPQLAFSITQATLPIILTEFKVKANNQAHAVLEWTTAQEQNSKLFEIQRSTDGNQFSVVAIVAASEFSSTATSYTYSDPDAASLGRNTVYYRLKLIDADGSFTYSPIRDIFLQKGTAVFSIGPNPSTGIFQLMMKEQPQTDMFVKIYNAAGTVVISRKIKTQVSTFNLSSHSRGLYILEVDIPKSGKRRVKIFVAPN